MRPPFCTCAIAARKAPSDGMPAACRQNAAVTRKNAITPIERPPPGRGTPRAANAGCGKRRSRSACGTLGGRPRVARSAARRAAGGYSQATRPRSRSEKHGSGKRSGKHTVKGCGTPLSLAENRRARRRRKPFCVQYVRLRALLVTERKDGAAAARKAIAAAFCALQTPRSGVFPLRASPATSSIIIPYFGENDKDSSKDFSQIAKFYPPFIFFS